MVQIIIGTANLLFPKGHYLHYALGAYRRLCISMKMAFDLYQGENCLSNGGIFGGKPHLGIAGIVKTIGIRGSFFERQGQV